MESYTRKSIYCKLFIRNGAELWYSRGMEDPQLPFLHSDCNTPIEDIVRDGFYDFYHLCKLLEHHMKSQADVDTAIAALTVSVDKLTTAVAAILPVTPPFDLTPEVDAIAAQQARADAITATIPVPTPPTA